MDLPPPDGTGGCAANALCQTGSTQLYRCPRAQAVLAPPGAANLGLTLLSDDYTPRVHIGNHVSIAANVTFVPMASANNGQEINTYPYVRDHLTKAADIVVEDEVWIGADVTILPGVHIGRCAVIGAGSVVTGDVEAYHIYAGVPARKIRDIRTGERVQ